jgi:hypothetical protein
MEMAGYCNQSIAALSVCLQWLHEIDCDAVLDHNKSHTV